MKRVATIGIITVLGIIGGTSLAGCGRREGPEAPPMQIDAASSEKIRTSGTAPDLYVTCWKGLVFMTMGSQGGMVQVLDADGKPMKCDR